MTSNLGKLFHDHGLRIVEQTLQSIAGQPTEVVAEAAQYQKLVVNRAWEQMPLPIRLIGRDKLPWDALFAALRKEVFEAHAGKLALRTDAGARLAAIAGKLMPFDGPAAPAVSPLGSAPSEEAIAPARPTSAATVTMQTPPAGATQVAIGIDLGTTYSVVAHVDTQGRPWSIHNAVGDMLTPSVVFFDESGPLVGKEALKAGVLDAGRVADVVKRDMGSKHYRKAINGDYLPPEVISSFILRSLKTDAERKIGPVKKAVITVPAYFDEPRRRATIDAGRLAGLEVMDIINEPTAAAIAYGFQLGFLNRYGKAEGERPLRVMVYDLGGGTFDVTIVEIRGSDFKAIATDGDVRLGGKDWDEKLVEMAALRFREKFREDPRTNPESNQELWLSVEEAKRTLSERPKAMLMVNHLGSRLRIEITREEFEQATAALLRRTRSTSEIVVRQAGLSWNDIDKVLLIGGSTRMPMVTRMLEELTGKKPDQSISPDEAVAHGAALYADLLLHRQGASASPTNFSITNVNSHSLGIVGIDPKTGREYNKILIPKNTQLPAALAKTFQTFKENQRSVRVRILEGESERPEACTQVGVCVIRDLPPNIPKGWPVTVRYSYEENGRLQVAAKLKGYDAQVTTTFIRDNNLPEGDLMLWAEYIAQESSKMQV